MLSIIKRVFINLREMGVTPQLSIADAKRVKSTNTLGFLPMVMYLIYIVFGLIHQYYFPVTLCSVLLILSIIALYYNRKQKYLVAKNLLFAINCFAVLVTYNSLNIDYTICCYFFPLIMAYEIIFPYKKEARFISFAILFLTACFLACLLLPKGLLYYYEMTPDLFHSSQLLNVVIPFFLAIIFLYEILGIHNNAQEQLILAKVNAENASKAKTDFLNHMSHELRTPLNGIIGSTDLLLSETMSDSQKRYFDIIQYSGEHMLNLVNDILDFSKVQSGKLELDKNKFNLSQLLASIGKMFKTITINKSVTFHIVVEERIDQWIESDDLRLTQILHNLLSNSFKFTEKGSIILKAKILEENKESLKIHFAVQDTGIGIKEEHQLKIFESFTQADSGTSRKYGGTGLGLTISRQLVQEFGSELKIESSYGQGSIFSFDIVFAKYISAVVETNTNIKSNTTHYGGALKVLVADDNPINMVVVKNFFKKWGIDVTETINGADAVSMFRQNKYDIVLLDLEMPKLDGYGAVKIIRSINTTIPVVAFTAATYENIREDLLSKGFNDYITKPFRPNELAAIIKLYA
jgi:signal transduction histidine kinase